MKKMSEYTYHIGLQLRAYPSYKQKSLIKMNAGASRFVYNRLVAVHDECYQLKKTAPYCPADEARLLYLQDAYSNARNIANVIPFLGEKGIDSDMINQSIKSYRTAWNDYKKEPWHGVPTFHKKSRSYSNIIKLRP